MNDFCVLNEKMRNHAKLFDICILDWEYEKLEKGIEE